MARYPDELLRTHRLRDGRTVTIRPVRADDADRMRRFLAATSEDSRYNRFHEWIEAPSCALIRFLTNVDYDRHMAFVCSVARGGDEELVGEACYVANPDGRSCDFGILVHDAWRKSGIAGLLMAALFHAASARGFATIEGLVLADNAPMLRFAHTLGFDIEVPRDDITEVRIVMKLPAAPSSRESEAETAATTG